MSLYTFCAYVCMCVCLSVITARGVCFIQGCTSFYTNIILTIFCFFFFPPVLEGVKFVCQCYDAVYNDALNTHCVCRKTVSIVYLCIFEDAAVFIIRSLNLNTSISKSMKGYSYIKHGLFRESSSI